MFVDKDMLEFLHFVYTAILEPNKWSKVVLKKAALIHLKGNGWSKNPF